MHACGTSFIHSNVEKGGEPVIERIDVTYQGNLRCEAEMPSTGARVLIDVPTQYGGSGESFSGTDMLAAGLGGCLMGVIAAVMRRRELDMEGAKITVLKEMAEVGSTRRITRMDVAIHMPHDAPPDVRKAVERSLHACPVHNSLNPDIEMTFKFEWGSRADSP